MKGFWTPAEYDALRELAQDHRLTANDIMDALNKRFRHGRTRNAVLGAAHRIGIAIGVANQGSVQSRKIRQARNRPPEPRPPPRILTMRDVHERLAQLPPPPKPEPPPVAPYAVADLTSRHCRWIDGDPRDPRPFACDNPKDPTKTYCAAHWARSFTRPGRQPATSPLAMLHKRGPAP